MSATSLARLFVDCRGASGRDVADRSSDLAALETQLGAVIAAGKQAWPGVRLEDEKLVGHLARHASDAAALAELRAEDLFLAAACLDGNRAALAAFEKEFLGRVPALVRRIAKTDSAVDEIAQQVRVLILAGEPPRLTQYSGRGPLHGWVRVVALNTALMAQRRKKENVHHSRDLSEKAELIGGKLDPEADLVRQRHRAQFQAALDEALATLTARERNLLRAYFVDDMSIDKLGVRFRVHRATAARWLQAAREKLLAETRRRVGELVALTPSEFDSLAAMLKSELTLSFGGATKTH
jgi:RNA polymerase sigma-70 factor (ECF subfamily)